MTVRELLCNIVDTYESPDQEVILFSEVEVHGASFKSAVQHKQLKVNINGDCLQLFMVD